MGSQRILDFGFLEIYQLPEFPNNVDEETLTGKM
jgi:hypothetical protein